MEDHLYMIAVVLIIAWAIGFIGGGIIHILLVFAVIAVITRVFHGKRSSQGRRSCQERRLY